MAGILGALLVVDIVDIAHRVASQHHPQSAPHKSRAKKSSSMVALVAPRPAIGNPSPMPRAAATHHDPSVPTPLPRRSPAKSAARTASDDTPAVVPLRLPASAAPAPNDAELVPIPRPADPRLAEEEAALKRLILHRDGADHVSHIVVDRVVPRLMAFLRYRYRSLPEDDAYDVAADALRIAIERRAEFDPTRATNVRTWLYGIAVIKAADHFRRRGTIIPLEPDHDPHSLTQTNAHASSTSSQVTLDRAEQIRAALLTLPAQQRKAALARYVDDLAPAEIDQHFGWKPNTAHVYLSLARKSIRKKLGEQGPTP